jgi:hypothetical protein
MVKSTRTNIYQLSYNVTVRYVSSLRSKITPSRRSTHLSRKNLPNSGCLRRKKTESEFHTGQFRLGLTKLEPRLQLQRVLLVGEEKKKKKFEQEGIEPH